MFMKTLNTMTPIQIASSVIEKLQEQNRISMAALQKADSDIRGLEKQLKEKEQLIKVMEGQVRVGSNTYLEMSNKQKDIAIKHLELQIQKLLKEKEDLERQVTIANSDICAKCETKYFLGAPLDNKPTSKYFRKCLSKDVPSKQMSESESQKRVKTLEKIIEHKDKRIFSLTKEIQRLSQVEKELSNKVFRLTKLLPMSYQPAEVLTECLLKEIQSLELQIQHYQEKHDTLSTGFGQYKSNPSYSNLFDSKSKTSFEQKDISDKNYSSASKKVDRKFNGSSSKKKVNTSGENIQKDNGSVVSKLHLLYNDVVDLKQLFASENEKLYLNLSKESLRNDMLKTQWEEVIARLSEIAESVQSLLQINSEFGGNSNDKEDVILRLQGRLKEALDITTQYENENSDLKATIKMLKEQIERDRISHQYTQTDLRQSPIKTPAQNTVSCHSVDTQHLKELLNEKQKQLDLSENHIHSVESHLRTYQNLYGNLQSVSKQTTNEAVNSESMSNVTNSSNQMSSSNKNTAGKEVSSETKLKEAESNIKTLEDAIKELKKKITSLAQENLELSQLNSAKYSKIVSDANIDSNAALEAKLVESEKELVKVQSLNKDLENNIHRLEEENVSILNSLQEVNSKLEYMQSADEQRTILQSKLDIAEKNAGSLETNIAQAQNVIEELKDKNAELKSLLQISESRKSLEDQAEKDEIMALKNELILKENEIKKLQGSLSEIESIAAQMSFYRKTLRREIENLCDFLLEKSDPNTSSASREAIINVSVLKSARALLQLDEDFNTKSKTNNIGGAVEEMQQQVTVFLTEVARIHELLIIHHKKKDDILKEYLESSDILSHLPGQSYHSISGVVGLPRSSDESSSGSSSESSVHTSRTNKQTSAKTVHSSNENEQAEVESAVSQVGIHPQAEQDESGAQNLLSRCSQLEDLLEKEQQDHQLCRRELEVLKENVANLQGQLNSKSKLSKLLNQLIEMMRSKGCSDEIAMEQLRSDIKWLVDENQKMFAKSTLMQVELCKHKEENVRMQRDIDNLRRECVNEKYEHAKANNELKNLRDQILNSASSMLNNEDLST